MDRSDGQNGDAAEETVSAPAGDALAAEIDALVGDCGRINGRELRRRITALVAAARAERAAEEERTHKAALDFWAAHAHGPDEVRYLMAYRLLSPEDREKAAARADLLLEREARSPSSGTEAL